jgi:hypothetical protein
VPLDDLYADTGVGIPARRDCRDRDDEDESAEQD